ncbi:MAG: ribosome biogenesis GTPase Der [Candidatus Kerfeldbacteria bacterium]|nr:ribosome biogenesis GTPase Der [Candidatus Kerfeldbacteria bacterium]
MTPFKSAPTEPIKTKEIPRRLKLGATVALIGRANVGKSSLFNRLLGRSQAIVSAESGTTRDRNTASLSWRGINFWLMDTGGLDPTKDDAAGQASLREAKRAIQEAQVIIFVIDNQTGLTAADRIFSRLLRQKRSRTVLAINKVDHPSQRTDFNPAVLGLPEVILVSAKNGTGTGDLLDAITSKLSPAPQPAASPLSLGLSLLGRTNVGKSSIFNKLLGEERSIVLSTPHTTRDKQHDYLEHEGVMIELIDTAGIRRQLSGAPLIEQQSVRQSLAALQQTDVALLVLDGAGDLSWQDQRLGGLVAEAGCGALILVNKADLVKQTDRSVKVRQVARWLPMLAWADLLWISAKSGENINLIIPRARAVAQARQLQLTHQDTEKFMAWLKRTKTTAHLPLISLEQTSTKPPRFRLLAKTKERLPAAIGDWVARELRRRFKFNGSPLRVTIQGVRKI